MSTKGYNKKNSDVYVLPLPYRVQQLPPLILHNPVSLFMYSWAVFKALRSPSNKIHRGVISPGTSVDSSPRGAQVTDVASIMQLWQEGFFGKGTLSRSEPSWFGRTSRRLGLDGGEMTLEELTELRRAKRRQFKRDRELQQQEELLEKKRKEGFTPEHTTLVQPEIEVNPVEIRKEDRDLITGETIHRLEYLQLTPCETVFLHLGLGVLDLGDESLSSVLTRLLPSPEAWREYIVYHYFRSLGWCVRDGVKFGSDFLLYRKGPPFQHAEFAIMVMEQHCQPSWWWLHSNIRVLGGAKKTLTLAYVESSRGVPEMPNWAMVKNANDFRKQLERYAVKSVMFSRFAASRNRD